MIAEATYNFIPHKMSKRGSVCHLPWVSTSVKHLMNKCDRMYKKARHSGKAVHLPKYKRLRNITTKSLHVAHNKYANEVMGVSTPESLETGPDNAVFNGIQCAWLYLKLLQTESQGIPALVPNNHIDALQTAPKLRPYASNMMVCSWKKTSGIYHKSSPLALCVCLL